MKIAIVSFRFVAGLTALLHTYKSMFSDLNCDVKLFLDNGYNGFIDSEEGVVFFKSYQTILEWCPDIVISYNISNTNIGFSRICRKRHIRFFYILHEPWMSFKELLTLRARIPRRVAANIVNYITCKCSYKVILASQNGKNKYETYMKGCNNNYSVFPLLFCDEYDPMLDIERKYFSYIGGFTENRGCLEFLNFIAFAVSNDLGIKFKIATRTNISSYLKSDVLQKAISDGLLEINHGKAMTTKEINRHYRESICVWNAYISSTQSGVLPNALMQGAPVIVGKRGVSVEVVKDKVEGCYVSIPHDNDEIYKAYLNISTDLESYVNNARLCFTKNYYYKSFLSKALEVYEIE